MGMQRRRILSASFGLGLAPVATKTAPAQAKTTRQIEAPDDVKVTEIPSQDGYVHKGAILFQLYSHKLAYMDLQIDTFSQQVKIAKRPLEDGRASEHVASLKEKAKYLDDNRSIYDDLYKQYMEGLELGFASIPLTPTTMIPARFIQTTSLVNNTTSSSHSSNEAKSASVTTQINSSYSTSGETNGTSDTNDKGTTTSAVANPNYKNLEDLKMEFNKIRVDCIEADIQAKQADLHLRDAVDRLKITEGKIEKIRVIYNELLSSLTIRSPFDGIFKCYSAVGLTVKTGHKLGELSGG